jgi:MFS family permease
VFAAFAVGVGSGLAVLDNVALIVESHETTDDDDGDGSTGAESSLKANAVALFSACNTGGRIVLGLLSDRAVASGRASRAACLAAVLAGLAVAMLALAFANLSTILGSVALTAFWYGGLWVLVPALVADLFGNASYGRIYGLVSLAPTAGSWLLYDDLSVRLYDEYENDANGTCTDDPACFKTMFVVLAVCCAAGAAAAWAAARWPPRRAFAFAKAAHI